MVVVVLLAVVYICTASPRKDTTLTGGRFEARLRRSMRAACEPDAVGKVRKDYAASGRNLPSRSPSS